MANSAFSVTGTSSGNNLVLLNSHTVMSGATNMSFTNLPLLSTYSKLQVVARNITLSSADNLSLQFSINNGSSWINSNYAWYRDFISLINPPIGDDAGNNSATSIILNNFLSRGIFTFDLYGINDSSTVSFPAIIGSGSAFNGTSYFNLTNTGVYNVNAQVNACQIFLPSSTFVTGDFYLYGYGI